MERSDTIGLVPQSYTREMVVVVVVDSLIIFNSNSLGQFLGDLV